MVSGDSFQAYVDRLEEALLYVDQGLVDGAVEVFEEILREVDTIALSQAEKDDLRLRIQSGLKKAGKELEPSREAVESKEIRNVEMSMDPAQVFEYGTALMDGQFWEEAIHELKQASEVGYRVNECLELCGDAAFQLERWEEAIGYYQIIYSDPDILEDLKKQILIKITKCSQAQRKTEAQSALRARMNEARLAVDAVQGQPEVMRASTFPSSLTSLEDAATTRLLGQQIVSWEDEKGEYRAEGRRTYRVLNLVQAGITSVVVELEREGTGERFAGQTLSDPFRQCTSPRSLARWVHALSVVDSSYLAKVYDLAHSGDTFFVVREYFPLSLADILAKDEILPVPLAVYIAYSVLDGLGDLHLHMGRDEQIRNIYHLDLRPSRVLLDVSRPVVKIYNGGLWKMLEESNPDAISLRSLPLPFLPYRAPEQFRPYMARRKPPVFTDIYLFGTLFYEMLTGTQAFRASSYEEYEIQHCDQYPMPPKVWRPEIPDELNELIMKCLQSDPTKRWRSTTQISLILEKSLNRSPQWTKDAFRKHLKRAKMA